ncbi:hypothetical protein PT283_01130 [Acetobacteraceae bacterium ESL0697]|nr:hypothetical protein [Acetobacteraceae bacterium ESL0697]
MSYDGAYRLSMNFSGPPDGCLYIDRNKLNQELLAVALKCGARLIETSSIKSVKKDGPEFVVSIAEGEYISPFLIDATGKAHIASSLAGDISVNDCQLDSRQNMFAHFENFGGVSLECLTIICEQFGFVYAIPLCESRFSLGWVSYKTKESQNNEEEFLDHVKNIPAIKSLLSKSKIKTKVISAKNKITSVISPVSNGVFITGDALGFRDPFFYDGISFALASGTLAGICCADEITGVMSHKIIATRYASGLEDIEDKLKASTKATIKHVRDSFSPSQLLDPHIPNVILAALMGLTSNSVEHTEEIFRDYRRTISSVESRL